MLGEKTAKKPVELIERVEKYKGHVITVYEDKVKVGGRETYWDYIHHNGAAAVLPVTDEGKILMVRQYRHPLGRYILEIPAGKRDGDEAFKTCAIRELEEETGYKAESFEYLLSINTTVAFLDEFIEIYLARGLYPGEVKWDPDEELGLEEWELDDLIGLIRKGELTDSKTVSAIMTYADMVK